jgi:hypothetical protein
LLRFDALKDTCVACAPLLSVLKSISNIFKQNPRILQRGRIASAKVGAPHQPL